MIIHDFLASTYATSIFYSRSKGFDKIPEPYHERVKQIAAANYRDEQIDDARYYGTITQQEFEEVMAYKYPEKVEK